jgi:hypothetical protein
LHHERDLHRDVIRDDSEIVDRRRIRSEDYEILEVLVRESDALVNEIIPFGGTLGNSKANDERITRVDSSSDLLGGESIASPVVLERFLACLGSATTLIQLFSCAEAAVRCAGLEHSVRVLLMTVEIRALVYDFFVPVETEPRHSVEDCARALVGAAHFVCVFDAEQKISAEVTCVEPVEECSACAADVQISCR